VSPRHGRSDLLSYLSPKVPSVVVVALQDPDVPMAGESLDGPNVSAFNTPLNRSNRVVGF